MSTIRIFGIRHHGAGSSRRMIAALQEYQPDVIALELPAESKLLIPQIQNPKIQTPIAFLYYQSDFPDHCIYLPLATFSPEYQAIQFASKNKIDCIPIDLPAGISLVSLNFKNNTEEGLSKLQKRITRDPIAFLARQAGYTDSERWWETHFEQWTAHDKLFDHIQNLMSELRKISLGQDDAETLIREQYMRQCLRKLTQNKYKRIAVICGAWHGPVLSEEYLKTHPEETYPDLKSIAIDACIIPWTYKNMSLENGYSAGIVSPIWHEALFKNPTTAVSAFLVHAGRQMRNGGKEISASSAIDAARLSNMLAVLREIPLPGIDELLESCITVFNHGNAILMDEFKEKILCGSVQGSVDLGNQSLPLVALFYNTLKRLRLNKFWKVNANDILELDLRKTRHLEISKFLHFTKLLELNWAQSKSIESKTLGNFHEHWQFQWQAELEINLIQLALFGNSFSEAARRFVEIQLHKNLEWHKLALYLNHSLKAGFSELLPMLSDKIKSIVINHTDVLQLSTMIRPLISGLEYGSIHKIDIQFINEVIQHLIPKVVIALPEAVKFIDSERSLKMIEVIPVIQVFFDKFNPHEYNELWIEQCQHMIQDDLTHPRIQGKIWNLLVEREYIAWEIFLDYMKFQFSQNADIPKSVFWFEGFLHNQSAFFLMHTEIVNCLDQWMASLEPEHFKKYLPLLRRVFDQIGISERRRILNQLQHNQKQQESSFSLILMLDNKRQQLLDAFKS